MVPVLSSSNTSTSPEASTAASAHGEDIVLEQTVHAGDADALSNPPMVVGIKHKNKRNQYRHGEHSGGINAERFQTSTQTSRKSAVSAESRMVSAISLGGFLAVLAAFNQRDHSVEKPSPGLMEMRILISSGARGCHR